MTAVIDRVVDCTHPRAAHQHGTYLAWAKDGCRCEDCVAAAHRYQKRSAYRTATGSHTYTDAGPARQHVKKLLRTLTVGQIEARSGVNRTAIRVLVGDFPGRPRSKRITRTTEAALLALTADRVGTEANGLVDAAGTRRRLQALCALGHPMRTIERRLGLSSRTTYTIVHLNSEQVTAATRAAVAELYDELSMQIPPASRYTTAVRNVAARHGWVPPLAWDDDSIDNPTAHHH